MKYELNEYEARVLGCLIEKEKTTPDQYPLSLNALANACNQKTNREPVMQLDEATVQDTIDGLMKKYLVSEGAGFGSRVTKYKHRMFNSLFGSLEFTEQQVGIVCVLLLRGPQTPGELRTRTNRLCKFADVTEVETTLGELQNDFDEPYVTLLEREPGKREARYAHLFSGPVAASAALQTPAPRAVSVPPAGDSGVRLDALEREVALLREELGALKRSLGEGED